MEKAIGWKVPFREVYCDTLPALARETVWCHLVLKIFPNAVDLATDVHLHMYLRKPFTFFEQYEAAINGAIRYQDRTRS